MYNVILEKLEIKCAPNISETETYCDECLLLKYQIFWYIKCWWKLMNNNKLTMKILSNRQIKYSLIMWLQGAKRYG